MIIKDCKVYDADTTDRAVILQSFSNLRERLYSTSAPSQAVMFGAVRQYFFSDWYNFFDFVKFKKR